MGTFIITSRDLDAAGQFVGSVENDVIRVEDIFDEYPYIIFGLSGNDSVESASGEDTVFGLEGNDTLDGSSGNDIIYGNQGKTVNLSEIPNRNENADLIVDFTSGEDKLGLVGVLFEELIVSPITPSEVEKVFTNNAFIEYNPLGSASAFFKIEAGGELLAVLAQDRNNFTLRPDDIVIF